MTSQTKHVRLIQLQVIILLLHMHRTSEVQQILQNAGYGTELSMVTPDRSCQNKQTKYQFSRSSSWLHQNLTTFTDGDERKLLQDRIFIRAQRWPRCISMRYQTNIDFNVPWSLLNHIYFVEIPNVQTGVRQIWKMPNRQLQLLDQGTNIDVAYLRF